MNQIVYQARALMLFRTNATLRIIKSFKFYFPGKKTTGVSTRHTRVFTRCTTRIYALHDAYLSVKTLLIIRDFMRFYAFLFVFSRCYAILRSLSIDINFQIEIRSKLYIKISS